MIINPKANKVERPLTVEEKLFKMLESMDWKLWEMMNMMKAQSEPSKPSVPTPKPKTSKKVEE
jgi:hypothetical protein